jgi:SAM-dependent methyltransferase
VVATARSGNVLGGGDFAEDRLVPDIVRAVLAGNSVVLRHPQATRPWQHVLDCLAGYFCYIQALASRRDVPRALNFGPARQHERTVAEIAQSILAAVQADTNWVRAAEAGPRESRFLSLDATLARRSLGWTDRYPSAAVVALTAAWYREFRRGGDMRAFSHTQIDAFMAKEAAPPQALRAYDAPSRVTVSAPMPTSSRVLTCRSCGEPLRVLFADLGMTPFSNAFRAEAELAQAEPYYPLCAFVCEACKLVQLQDFGSAEEHFHDEYAYLSSFSSSWLAHAKMFAETAQKRFSLTDASFVVEIGSNDGYLLQFIKAKAIPCLGIDPAANCAAVARQKFGLDTLVTFFNKQTAQQVVAQHSQADLLIANNVLAHVPDINDFIAGIAIALKPQGVASFEFPHLLSLMRHNQFDTVYHEHFSYLSLTALAPLFTRHGLMAFDVERLGTHGGSLRLFVGRENGPWAISTEIQNIANEERDSGLNRIATYASFAERVVHTKRQLLSLLITLKENGATIAGYGAPAKGNTLLNYCGIRTDIIDFTVDRSTVKQGRYLPGSAIPILAPDAVRQRKPDYLLILPWNLQDEIVEQMSFIKEWGGRFIVPIPTPTILD